MSAFRAVRRSSRRAAVGAVVALPLALGACAGDSTGLGINLVSEQQVAELGAQSWQQMRQEMPASRNATYQRAARQISDRLLQAAGLNPSEWEVQVFQGKEANAFALPGRKIGVYEGMFGVAKNEAQLAAVIGHEIGHVQANHSQERLSSQMATQLGVDLAGAALGQAGLGQPQQVAALLGAGAQYGLLLPYSRNQELDADRLGLMHMARAGYDPRAAVELWQNMSAQGGGQPPVFASTHPGHEQRIQRLQQLMPEALAVYRDAGGRV
ncbi:M48 family metallopeptidase [Caenispirillum bisanense]|uniref:Peptidase family M48 n=1 Tax=Caenispirillum bisanense TaxID=414052 RepID=A0A286GZW0_9PROT|nr:M48 family metallopeptidase [Caenispirillum bisanense]SOE00736.1 Peptidase family M48 [Caenispirillum bisanense]